MNRDYFDWLGSPSHLVEGVSCLSVLLFAL